MPDADRILMLKLLGDTGSIDKSLRKTDGRIKGLARSAASWGKAAAFDLAISGVERLTDALGDAWTGFREGEMAASRLGNTWKNLKMPADELADVIERIGDTAKDLAIDDVESIDAFNKALLQTGGRAGQAMNRLHIAMNLVANGSAPNLKSALKIVDGAAKGSDKVIRDFGLTADTAGGRVRELGRRVRGAAKAAVDMDPLGKLFNDLAEDLESVVGSLATGDWDGALQGFRDMSEDIAGFWDRIAPAVTGTLDKLSGGAFSGLFEGFDLPDIGERLAPLSGQLGKVVPLLQDFQSILQSLQGPSSELLTFIQPLIDGFVRFWGGVVAIPLDVVGGIFGSLAAILRGDPKQAMEELIEAGRRVGVDIDEVFGGLPGTIITWVEPIAKAAGDVGSAIFDGVLGFVSDIPDAIGRIAQDAVNRFIRAWNSLDFAIPAFDLRWDGVSVPNPAHGTIFDAFGTPTISILPSGNFHIWDGTGDLIPDVGGGGGRNPRSPQQYRKGLWEVQGDGVPAILHRGEMVQPADFADEYRRNGGGGGGMTVNITVLATPGTDRAALGRELTGLLRSFRDSGGGPAIKAAVG